ncbi:MAG: toll/interleukin-1 receptor domain-containing protein [Desulfobacteraceae bacterium]|nr:toll/interleukin-1 receptor domain-containing protein [Desulfobacteraceae bacterium]
MNKTTCIYNLLKSLVLPCKCRCRDNLLKQNNYNPWIDKEDLIPGHDWELEIDKAIKECNFFIACLSSNSVTKEGYFQRELKRGLDFFDRKPEGSIYLIPVRLDDCIIPHRFQKLHWCDFFSEKYDEKLLRAINTGINLNRL